MSSIRWITEWLEYQCAGMDYGEMTDGTLVVAGLEGYVYFLKEKNVDNGGLAEGGWPRAYHDNYHSNNAGHPFKWDRSGPASYPSLQELLKDKPDDRMCNRDERCYPTEYFETCDWGGTFDWAGKEIPCDSPEAYRMPRPDPRDQPCLVEGIDVPEVECPPDAGVLPDAGAGDRSKTPDFGLQSA